jgi:pimeloyl-ACP methyl ester carboxylesterase
MPYPSLLFVHGAASGAWVWDTWRRHLKPFGWETNVLDLRGHGRSLPVDFSTVTVENYLSDLESVTGQITTNSRHPVIVGWSMGGLVAMLYAAQHEETPALVLLSPAPPLEVAGRGSAAELSKIPSSALGPEYYGLYPDDLEASRPALFDLTEDEARRLLASSIGAQESGVVWRQIDRGLSVPAEAVKCPVLVIYGEEERARPPAVNQRVAEHFGGESLGMTGAGHYGIVYHEPAVADAAWRLDAWLRRNVSK